MVKKTDLNNAFPLTRRGAIKGFGMAGMAAAMASAPFGRSAFAQSDVTLRWWSPQSSPAQLDAYKFQIAAFEAANPGVKIVFEPTSDEGYPAQLAAAFASGEVPDVVTHLPSFSVASYYAQGLVEPARRRHQGGRAGEILRGRQPDLRGRRRAFTGTGIGNTAADMLWVRKDLMEKAGIDKIPATWDELRAACQKMQGGGIYGVPLPFGRNSAMTSLIIIGFIHGAGGQICSPDLEVALDSDATLQRAGVLQVDARVLPRRAPRASRWGEMPDRFRQRRDGDRHYAGRVLVNVNNQNPDIADKITCQLYPTISNDIAEDVATTSRASSSRRRRRTRRWPKKFAAFLFEPDGYIKQLLAAPGHVLPVLEDDRGRSGLHVEPDHQEIPEGSGADGGGCGARLQPRLREPRAQAEHQGGRHHRLRRAFRDGAACRAEQRRRQDGDRRYGEEARSHHEGLIGPRNLPCGGRVPPQDCASRASRSGVVLPAEARSAASWAPFLRDRTGKMPP